MLWEKLRSFFELIFSAIAIIAMLSAAIWLYNANLPAHIRWGLLTAPVILQAIIWTVLRGNVQSLNDFEGPVRSPLELIRNGLFFASLFMFGIDFIYCVIALIAFLGQGETCPPWAPC